MTDPILLNDEQMQLFVRHGYVRLDAGLPASFHADVCEQITDVFTVDGNPGNDILPRVPDLQQVLSQPRIRGALTSLLGPDYLLHPHRHCHLNAGGSDGQRMHQDSYEADQNVRHHRIRWLMAFYYPQDVDEHNGPSSVVPATQYLTEKSQHDSPRELPLHGSAGTVTIVHYDLWHRAMANAGNNDRFMVKFLFTRMVEPQQPSWYHEAVAWPTSDQADEALCTDVWNWLRGVDSPPQAVAQDLPELVEQLQATDEMARYAAAYRLGAGGSAGVSVLVDALRRECERRVSANLERSHTNPAQFDAAYGLTAAGAAAVGTLTQLLSDEVCWLRASAADVLGDIGLPAAEAVPDLVQALQDESEWVRRNAVEALGNIGSAAGAARAALAASLTDPDDAVRHNAALALAKIAGGDRAALQAAGGDDNRYVRELASEALTRS